VISGDNVVLLGASKEQHRVRLAGINAPERKQLFGPKSVQYVSDMLVGQDVTVDRHKRDRYHRLVGKIVYDGFDVNLAVVRAGMA